MPWRIHTCDLSHSHVYGGWGACYFVAPFTCVPWRMQMCDMAHSHEWHDSFIFVHIVGNGLIQVLGGSNSNLWRTCSSILHNSIICVTVTRGSPPILRNLLESESSLHNTCTFTSVFALTNKRTRLILLTTAECIVKLWLCSFNLKCDMASVAWLACMVPLEK